MVCFVRLLCQTKRSFSMTGWLRVGLNVTTTLRPPRLGVQQAPWSYFVGGAIIKLGGGWRGMVY